MERSKRVQLTEVTISRLKPPAGGRIERWDTSLPGFGYRLTSTGAKSFVVALRKPGAKHPARFLLGSPPRMSLKEARKKAGDALEDPAAFFAEREQIKTDDANTFGILAEQFLAHGRTKRGRLLRPATKKEYRRALLDYAKSLHDKPAQDIRRGEIADLISELANRRGATTAMRTRAALSRFFSWLLAKDRVIGNPVAGTEGFETGKRKRVLTDDELRAIWDATQPPSDFNTIVRMCLWTGGRRSEPGGMRDSEHGHVKTKEFDGEVWTVPGERTKNHRDLALPLPRQARDALEQWPRRVGRDLLFGHGPKGFQGWSRAKARLDDRIARANAERRLGRQLGAGEKPAETDALPPWDLHDLRRTVETRLKALGIRGEIVNRTLNHAAGPITERYDMYEYLREKADALQLWADDLDRIADSATHKRTVGRGEAPIIALSANRLP
jgi:integrase